MQLRRQPIGFDQFSRRFPADFMAGSITVGLLCAFLGIIVFAFIEDSHNSGAEQKASFVQALYSGPRYQHDFSPKTESLRRSTAKNMLRLEHIGILATDKLSNKDEKQIKATVTTGAPIHFRTSHLKWSTYWGAVLPGILIIYWILAWMVSLLVYGSECTDHREYLADLPWNKFWPWPYALFTLVPFGWFVWPISWKGVKRARAKAAAEEAEAAARAAEAGEVDEEAVDREIVDGEDTPRQHYQFVAAPHAAKALYVELRQGAWRVRLETKVEDLKRKLADRKQRLRQMGEDAKTYQREIGDFIADLAIKERQLGEPHELLELGSLEEEFKRIQRMPGVSGVRVLNDEVCILVKARIKYQGVLYDLGDWELSFGAEMSELTTRSLRRGVKSSWGHGNYPSYEHREGFCYGSRITTINEHIRIGQFAEAVDVAIDCLNSVNEGEEKLIPEAFKEVEE